MLLKVLDFYRYEGNRQLEMSSFTPSLKNPTFCILINKEGKTRELLLTLKGDFPYVMYPIPCGYEEDAYKNYKIIEDFLEGENRELLRDRWGLTLKEYNNLMFQLYKVLIYNHSFYDTFKKRLLVILGYLKFKLRKVKI